MDRIKTRATLALSILWMIVCLIMFFTIRTYSIVEHNYFVVGCIISYILCIYTWLISGNRLISIYSVFLLYAFFSNLGQSILSLLPNLDIILMIYRSYSLDDICNMLKFQQLCIGGLNLGTALYVVRNKGINTNELQSYYSTKKKEKTQQLVDVLLIISFAVMLYIAFRQIHLRQTLSYSEMYSKQIYGGFFRFGTIAFGFINLFKKQYVKPIIWGWFLLFLIFMITGTRSVAIPYFGALFISIPIIFPRIIQKKYYPFWAIGLIIGFASISIISNLRQSSLGEGISENQWWMSFLATIEEMGGSERPAVETMSTIKEGNNMLTIPYAILQAFIPSSILNYIVPETWTVNLGSWINTLHNENNSWGFSFIAEAYVNFGYSGWIFMIIYGYLISSWEIKSYRNIMKGDYLFAACFLTILCRQIFFARGQLQLGIDFFRPTFYIFLFWLFFIKNNNH